MSLAVMPLIGPLTVAILLDLLRPILPSIWLSEDKSLDVFSDFPLLIFPSNFFTTGGADAAVDSDFEGLEEVFLSVTCLDALLLPPSVALTVAAVLGMTCLPHLKLDCPLRTTALEPCENSIIVIRSSVKVDQINSL